MAGWIPRFVCPVFVALVHLVVTSSAFAFCNSSPDCPHYNQECWVSYCQDNNCVESQIQNGGSCSDGLYCNGADTCYSGSCSVHAGNPCTGGPQCKNVCSESLNTCNSPANTACSDNLFCNGYDSCDGLGSCSQHTGSPCPETACNHCNEQSDSCYDFAGSSCNDGVFCNGIDTCNGGGTCLHGGNPCNNPAAGVCGNSCNELQTNCNAPFGTACQPDGFQCTDDTCSGFGECVHPSRTGTCDDENNCTDADQCSNTECKGKNICGCLSNQECDDFNLCTLDECHPFDGTCSYTPIDDIPCDDGLFCNGNDSCLAGICSIHSGDPCNHTTGECLGCNELEDTCLLPFDTPCNNGIFCDGTDKCDGVGNCVSSNVDPCLSGSPCNNYCNETGNCFTPFGVEEIDNSFCNGRDFCDGKGGLMHEGNPCLNIPNACRRNCDETKEECLAPEGTSCDDGFFCNGDDICGDAGECLHLGSPCLGLSLCLSDCNESNRTCLSSLGKPCEDDGYFCNGLEFCDGLGNCSSAGNPCVDTPECSFSCDTSSQSCQLLSGNSELCLPPDSASAQSGPNSALLIGILVPLFISVVVVVLALLFFLIWKKKKSRDLGDMENSYELKMIGDVKVMEKIGAGNFGSVYKGLWNQTIVALKKLDKEQLVQFNQEAAILQKLFHPNVVQFFGIFISKAKEHFMVMEYMNDGSVLDLLRGRDQSLSLQQMLAISKSACSGMCYLEDQKIIHKDLACRNLLITKLQNKYIVKVGDFGMSSVALSDYYNSEKDVAIPIRWTAPEAVERRRYSHKSDVWSMAIVMFEIFSDGAVPYANLPNSEVLEFVKKGGRLAKPDSCIDPIYEIWLHCWQLDPSLRPSFESLLKQLSDIEDTMEGEEDALVFSTRESHYLMTPKGVYEESGEIEVQTNPCYSKTPGDHPYSTTVLP